jgi:predicted ribosome quality control (RQC) complex YloA/Tae2 family protein
MPFDGIVTKSVVEELQEKIVQGRISKIYQPTDSELVITIRNQRKNHTLLLSIHPTYARFHLTDDKYQNPQEPPMFCMLLRKHLSGAIIESIEQTGLERIITFNVRSIDEIGDASNKCLVLELMGRHSNVMLLSENKEHIIDSLKHVSSLQNRYRTILPGQKYIEPPTQEKLNPLEIDGDEFIKKLDFNTGKLDQQIVNMLLGISPFIAREIVARAALGSVNVYKEKFIEMREQINKAVYQPTIYYDDKEDFHVIPIQAFKGEEKTFSSSNEMLDHFYSGKAERDRVKQQSRDLSRFIKNELDKNVRKLKIHEKTIEKAKKADIYQRRGELLTAHLHLVKQGESSVSVVDYYDPEQKEVTINLQTDKTPSENAQAFFTRYRKLLTSKQMITKEIRKTKREINYLEQLLQQIDIAREVDIEEIREELREGGYLRKQRQGKRKKSKKPVPEEYISTDGTPILVGKNNKQNEYVTNQLAHRNDTWLHTKDIPGSHVVIRSHEPSEETLLEAAQLAAYFSKAQQSSSVPVDYTLIRHVKKPNGAKPGYVTYDNQQTLFVTPDKSVVEKLKK